MLDDIDLFDAAFFGFTPREAEALDPQVRLFLQCAWAALEDAAYDPRSYAGRIGVFAGKLPSVYRMRNLQSQPDLLETVGALQLAAGNDADALASLVAYKLDLRGPSISLQTFCSTSLVAVHVACQSLLTQDCDVALAGGVAVDVPHGTGYLYEEGGILSPDGECRAFDASANGSVMGGGVGIVVLKRLSDALADGDQIYAIIRGSAVTNDGVVRASYGAPGLNGQAAVIAAALGNAGVDPRSIGYVVAHGTGTALGDAVELAAMQKVYPARRRGLLRNRVDQAEHRPPRPRLGRGQPDRGVAGSEAPVPPAQLEFHRVQSGAAAGCKRTVRERRGSPLASAGRPAAPRRRDLVWPGRHQRARRAAGGATDGYYLVGDASPAGTFGTHRGGARARQPESHRAPGGTSGAGACRCRLHAPGWSLRVQLSALRGGCQCCGCHRSLSVNPPSVHARPSAIGRSGSFHLLWCL